ncbi:hypothetical protein [Flagellimonas crocea]|uniref:hypothetical protein n=1 Tax=Flagellimonas crocea TaxID=3067311 RepID=UPI00296E4F1D|nr:hypothetical protein [Muricauda sp. DH64]
MALFKKLPYNFLLFGFLIAVFPQRITAQNPMSITLLNESTSIPPSISKINPWHPGLEVGTDVTLHENRHHKTYFSLSIRYIFHKNLYQAIALNVGFGYDYKMEYGGNLKTGASLGYMHTFSTEEEYRLVNGKYQPNRDKGNSRFISSLSFGLGHRFDPNNFESTEVFLKQQYWVEFPYSPGFIPIMSHSTSMLGTKFYHNN